MVPVGFLCLAFCSVSFRLHVSILIKESAVCLVAPSPSPTGESPNPYSIQLFFIYKSPEASFID